MEAGMEAREEALHQDQHGQPRRTGKRTPCGILVEVSVEM